MKSKATIYIGEDLSRVIGPTESLTARLHAIGRRYETMVDDLVPSFSLSEWAAILDANNGTDIGGADFVSTTLVWANVADSVGIGERHGCDSDSLVRRMQSLSAGELMAISEVCVRFWQSVGTDEGATDTTADAICAAGGKVHPLKDA